MNLKNWLIGAWRDDGQRAAVIGQYGDLRNLPMVLADIAVRGGVYAPADPTLDLRIAEGRRQMALEILRLAQADPAILMAECFQTRPPKER